MPLALDPAVGVEVAADAVRRAVGAGADEAKALHTYREQFEVNLATDEITLVRTTVSDAISITVISDARKGTVDLTGRAPDAVEHAVAQAVMAAQAGQADPANVLPDEPAEGASSDGDTRPDKEAMMDVALGYIEEMKASYPTLLSRDSIYSFTSTWTSYANSHGRTTHARRGRYQAVIVVAGRDESRATSFSYTATVSDKPLVALTSVPAFARMLDDTVASFDARPIQSTFVGDVIFTPQALATLVSTVTGALNGLALIRGTTPFLTRLGEAIAAPGLTLAHRPSALAGSAPFDDEGFVNRDLDVIRGGVLENFLVDWYSSRKLGRPMTTGCADFVVDPGDVALDDLIAQTERGIVLGRYSGAMPNQNLDFSGVAKNSFYVEDGKVVHPLAETMIAGNFRTALENIVGISRETIDYGHARYPWLSAGGITISTK